MRPELSPCPVVVDAALRLREHGVGRCPHGKALIGEDHLSIDPVEIIVPQPVERVGASLGADLVLAFQCREIDPVGLLIALALAPLHAVLVDPDPGKAIPIFRIDPLCQRLAGSLA